MSVRQFQCLLAEMILYVRRQRNHRELTYPKQFVAVKMYYFKYHCIFSTEARFDWSDQFICILKKLNKNHKSIKLEKMKCCTFVQ